MASDERRYQLQGSYTRYKDGMRAGFDSDFGPCKRRNFKTIESAIKAAKKELKENELPKVVKTIEERDSRGRLVSFELFAEDGHKFEYEEKHSFWHVDGVRIVDRITGKVLWQA